MAEILSRSDIFTPCRHRPAPPLAGRRVNTSSVSVAGFHRSPFRSLRSRPLRSEFHGRKLVVDDRRARPSRPQTLSVQMSLSIGKAMRWWEKGLKSNMKEISSAQDLVDSLRDAGNKLVVVDFFSPGCGGCKALHPKICQFGETNPDVMFLQINYEEHKSMCYSLNVHVLPFFRFYRGAHGRLCSFSCTNATIKKFRDQLAKHTTERCSLGPTRGLEESELMALAANKDLAFTYTKNPEPVYTPDAVPEPALSSMKQPVRVAHEYLEKAFAATAGR